MAHEELLYKIALSKIPGIGAKLGKILIAYCGGIEAIFCESKRRLLLIPGIGEQLATTIKKTLPLELAQEDLQYHQQRGHNILFFLDENYPARLKHFEDAPILFYVKGDFTVNPNRSVAIVGTRTPTPYGQTFVRQIVADLVTYDVQIISGLAYGIDALAHKTANKLNIENIAVMGTGMDVIYPALHRELATNICKNGAIISEYPINMRADKENFPRRNRVIAGLADVVIVIESAQKGGSLITANYANDYNKDVFALPGRVSDLFSSGCNALIKQYKAHLLSDVQDIAYIMRWEEANSTTNQQQSLFVALNKEEQEIMTLIESKESVALDWLLGEARRPLSALSNILLQLEFKGFINALPGKKYKATQSQNFSTQNIRTTP